MAAPEKPERSDSEPSEGPSKPVIPCFNILILGDSRLRHLKEDMPKFAEGMDDVNFEVLWFQGARIVETVRRGMKNMSKKSEYDLVYIITGVHELFLSDLDGTIIPRFTNEKKMVDHVLAEYIEAKVMISPSTKKVVFGDLTGLSFSMFNGEEEEEPSPQQTIVNDGVGKINTILVEWNKCDNIKGPRMMGHTHKIRHGRLSHRYKSTTTDGLQLTAKTREKLARIIVESVYHNIHKTCN